MAVPGKKAARPRPRALFGVEAAHVTTSGQYVRDAALRVVRKGPPGGMTRETWFRWLSAEARCSINTLWRWRMGDRIPDWKRGVAGRVVAADLRLRRELAGVEA